MATLGERLNEICADLSLPLQRGRNTALQALLGVSSGRISQLFNDGAKAKLGADSIGKLVEYGYNPDWIQTGQGQKRLTDQFSQAPKTAKLEEIVATLEAVIQFGRPAIDTLSTEDRKHLKDALIRAIDNTDKK